MAAAADDASIHCGDEPNAANIDAACDSSLSHPTAQHTPDESDSDDQLLPGALLAPTNKSATQQPAVSFHEQIVAPPASPVPPPLSGSSTQQQHAVTQARSILKSRLAAPHSSEVESHHRSASLPVTPRVPPCCEAKSLAPPLPPPTEIARPSVAPTCPSCLVLPTSPAYARIVRRYTAVYPSLRLTLSQLHQWSLWDRLFTHCTGRDLICKIVQHSCGLLQSIIEFARWIFKRLARFAAFRMMFGRFRRGAAGDMAAAAATAAAVGGSPAGATPTALNALVSATTVVLAPGASPVLLPSATPLDAWIPPYEVECAPADPVSHLLKHLAYTMYRARQVLRFGRWIYDIPDVRDSALELWYGHIEDKSMDEQEEEENWESGNETHTWSQRADASLPFTTHAHICTFHC